MVFTDMFIAEKCCDPRIILVFVYQFTKTYKHLKRHNITYTKYHSYEKHRVKKIRKSVGKRKTGGVLLSISIYRGW